MLAHFAGRIFSRRACRGLVAGPSARIGEPEDSRLAAARRHSIATLSAGLTLVSQCRVRPPASIGQSRSSTATWVGPSSNTGPEREAWTLLRRLPSNPQPRPSPLQRQDSSPPGILATAWPIHAAPVCLPMAARTAWSSPPTTEAVCKLRIRKSHRLYIMLFLLAHLLTHLLIRSGPGSTEASLVSDRSAIAVGRRFRQAFFRTPLAAVQQVQGVVGNGPGFDRRVKNDSCTMSSASCSLAMRRNAR